MKKMLFVFLFLIIFACSCSNQTIFQGNDSEDASQTKGNNEITTSDDTFTSDTKNKNLMKEFANSIKEESALISLKLTEDEYYLLSSNLWYEKNSYTLINNKGEIITTFNNVIGNDVIPGKINKNEPIILGISNYEKIDLKNQYEDNYNYGLYLPASNSFIVEPQYNYLLKYNENLYAGFQDKFITFFDMKGTILYTTDQSENHYIQAIGDYIWYLPITDNNIYVYNQDFQLVKELDGSNSWAYTYGDDYVIYETRESDDEYFVQLLDSSGELLLSKEILEKVNQLPNSPDNKMTSIINYKEIGLFLVNYGKYQFLLDSNYKMIDFLDTTSNQHFFVVESEGYYKYSQGMNNADIVRYNTKGEIILDKNGNSFSGALSNHVVYRFEKDNINLYQYTTGTEYKYSIPGYVSPYITSPSKDLYIIENGSANSQIAIYYKDKQIFEEKNYTFHIPFYNNNNTAYVILSPITYDYTAHTKSIVLNATGDIIYTSPYEETIISIDENYLQVLRGNYIGLVDYHGEFVYKMINSEFSDD